MPKYDRISWWGPLLVGGLFVAMIIFALTAGCQALGLQPAKSLDERIGYAYGTYTAVQESTASAVRSGGLTPAEGRQVLAIADQARTFLDGARAVETADPAGATQKLELASRVLAQLQTYLQSKGVK